MFGKPRYNKEKGVALCYSSRIVVTKNYREFRLKDALSKTQREILQQLNLKLRNDAEVNLAMFKQRVRKGRKSKLTDPALFSSLTDVLTGTI